ncbi:glycoside hydrolase family 2 TIM barrel-domain containing protein [Oceanibaculum pacificum]|nr:glycoside hydrolase family 2 TIM barrel-domain containing protein [Oceanibaculum pacificum]
MRLALLLIASLLIALPARAEVTVQGERILVDGKPFKAHGVAGWGNLEMLRDLGVTTIRTYGDNNEDVLDEAERLGLKVILGFWLEHPRRGFDYANPAHVEPQMERLRQFVLAHKDHPALLMWGIGNEVEAELTDDSQVWPAIEQAAKLVKSLDPDHPTLAVLAETGADKVAKVKAQAPSIDVLGVNSYGESVPSVPDRVRAQGWTGPLIVTELGAIGQWQAAKTAWGAAIEPTSTEKAQLLEKQLAAVDPKSAGQILFLWGWKQEVTYTWHSLLLPSNEWLQTTEVMAEAWGGKTPGGNHAPRIAVLHFVQGASWPRDQQAMARLRAIDPDGDPLQVEWAVMEEQTVLLKAGDSEPELRKFPEAVLKPAAESVTIANLAPGNYRLYVTIRDGKGAAATGNLPFRVQ